MSALVVALLFACLHYCSGAADKIEAGESYLSSPDCVNPIGEYGYCFELIKCRSLFSILKQQPVNRQSLGFLQKSACGFAEHRMPKVCCVDEDDIEGWKKSKTPSTEKVTGSETSAQPAEATPPPTTTTTTTTTTTPKPLPPPQEPQPLPPKTRPPPQEPQPPPPKPLPPPQEPQSVPPQPQPTATNTSGRLEVAFSLSAMMKKRIRRHPYFRLLPNTDICGLSITTEDRIIGGRAADLGEFPWMCLLAYSDPEGGDPQFACGGSLISPLYVLTASHCVKNLPAGFKIAFVRIGEHDQNNLEADCVDDFCADPVQDIEVEEVIAHEKYDVTKKKENDIALLRLKRPVKLGTFASPICLPFSLDLKSGDGSLETISKLTAAGWGRTVYDNPDMAAVLQTVRIPLVSTAECNEYYTTKVKLSGIDDSRFCAGGEEGIDSCRGDSGGPLMEALPIPDPTNPESSPIVRTFQFGVVSLGPARCGSKDQPGLYTKVSNYLIWILDNIRP